MTCRPISEIASYHAHIYFDDSSRAEAAQLRGRIEENLVVELGRWHLAPVGPHPKGMYQVSFSTDAFSRVVPWLMLNRGGLAILVHPNTGDELADHAERSLWLGERLPLVLDCLR